jgi:hypothetical protein
MLRERSVPRPGAQFTSRTLARVRRERWRSEQFVDVGFNVAIVAVVAALVAGLWMVLHRSGLSAVSSDAVTLFGSGIFALAHRVAPSLPLYVAATGVLATALVLWWWAEREGV